MAISLEGHRILIADDEPLITMDLSQAFQAFGAETLLAHDLRSASLIAEAEPLGAAVIDLQLKEQLALPVLEVLQARAIPFVVYTGYQEKEARNYANNVVQKPGTEEVAKKLAELLAQTYRNRGERSEPITSVSQERPGDCFLPAP